MIMIETIMILQYLHIVESNNFPLKHLVQVREGLIGSVALLILILIFYLVFLCMCVCVCVLLVLSLKLDFFQ